MNGLEKSFLDTPQKRVHHPSLLQPITSTDDSGSYFLVVFCMST